jgi:hypothetical protein
VGIATLILAEQQQNVCYFSESGCNSEVTPMTKRECLKRAAECNRLAETTSDPNMKLYLMRLALTWMQSVTEACDHDLLPLNAPVFM